MAGQPGRDAGQRLILADTSVWIDYLNGLETNHTNLLDDAIRDGVLGMGDFILLEILQGVRHQREYRQTKKALLTLDVHPMLGVELALQSADNYRALRRQGFTIRKTADVIIATFCISMGWQLLFSDRDFLPFTRLGLQAVVI